MELESQTFIPSKDKGLFRPSGSKSKLDNFFKWVGQNKLYILLFVMSSIALGFGSAAYHKATHHNHEQTTPTPPAPSSDSEINGEVWSPKKELDNGIVYFSEYVDKPIHLLGMSNIGSGRPDKCYSISNNVPDSWCQKHYENTGQCDRYYNHCSFYKNDNTPDTIPKTPEPEWTNLFDFTWCNKDGVNYCTMSRNQHIPQYCGSCWAHGAISALGDRIKIARGGNTVDINLAVQHVLNCGCVGSCHGGTATGVYQWLYKISQSGTGVSYETSQPYMACSSESDQGFCKGQDWTCNALNVARTCPTFGEKCVGLTSYPNATISDYGTVSGVDAMKEEIYKNGPIACGIYALPLLTYTTGIINEPQPGGTVDHIVSVVGWGMLNEYNKTDNSGGPYWIVRNSWGEYWGEMGYVKVGMGHNALNLESSCTWATVKSFTTVENQVHCYEGGGNCDKGTGDYQC